MSRKTIQNYFDKDHERIRDLFRQFQSHKHPDFSKARESFRNFKSALKRHMEIEEDMLFSVFESKTGLNDMGPTSAMRQEHKEIEAALEAIHEKVRHNDLQSGAEEKIFFDLLQEHIHKEEHLIYPMFTELLSEEECRDIFERIQKVPEDKHKGCCCHIKS